MNKRQKEVITSQLKAEQKILRNLKVVYKQAAKDCAERAAILLGEGETAQSRIYQAEYQRALEKQLNGILDRMNSKNYNTVSEYLNDCYTNGFIGSVYDTAGQGIPLVLPINQKQVIKAVQLDSKISEGLYSEMGKDTKLLKKQIKAQISRGISNGSSYSEIARNINGKMDIGYTNAVRIVRTEGHRIQSASALDAMYAAREKGADVVKQWDSTLDGKTRDSHRRLDGQLRELDEKFEIDGKKAIAPGYFGSPKEDCNCRCGLLQRARWALDEDELKTLHERAEYYGLDKTSNFEDFKEKYLKAVDISEDSGIIKKVEETNNYDELEKYLRNKYNIATDDSIKQLDFKTVRETLKGVESVFDDFPELSDNIKKIGTDKHGVMCCSGEEIKFNPKYYKDISEFKKMCENCSAQGWWPPNSSPASIGVHETGHAVEWLLLSKSNFDYPWQQVYAWNRGDMSGGIVSKAIKNIKKTSYGKGKKQSELMNSVSGYGATKKQECFAEAFADCFSNGELANPLSREIVKLAKEKYIVLKGT